MTALTTPRLVLREFAAGDWAAVHEYAADPMVVRYMPWGPNTEADSRAFVERAIAEQFLQPRREFELAVTLQAGGRLIGGAGLHVSLGRQEGYLGYCYHRAVWGHGYGTEAAGALIAFGFGKLGLHRICATCDVRNVASARVMEKNAMRREGLLRRNMLVHGSWRDSCLYALLEDEWHTRGA